MGDIVYLENVTTLQLDIDKCDGCKMCTVVCPHGVFHVEEKKVSVVNRDKCMECGACANNCPEDAIQVESGVGCAYGIINGFLQGSEPTCDCSGGSSTSCCS